MFNLFGRKTSDSKDTDTVLEAVSEDMPTKHKEYYRVGRTDNGFTTLTMLGDGYATMTLTMNQEACEQMIRMLEATFSATANSNDPA
jgi:hypothetical protein